MNDRTHMTENYIHYVFAFEFGNMSFTTQDTFFRIRICIGSFLSILKDDGRY